jgi:hypothetical protein
MSNVYVYCVANKITASPLLQKYIRQLTISEEIYPIDNCPHNPVFLSRQT